MNLLVELEFEAPLLEEEQSPLFPLQAVPVVLVLVVVVLLLALCLVLGHPDQRLVHLDHQQVPWDFDR